MQAIPNKGRSLISRRVVECQCTIPSGAPRTCPAIQYLYLP